MHAKYIFLAILVEPPALVEPEGRRALAGWMGDRRGHRAANASPDRLPEAIVSYDDTVLIAPHRPAERNGSVLRVAHILGDGGDAIALRVGQHIGQHESTRHSGYVCALHRSPAAVVHGQRARRRRPNRQVMPFGACFSGDEVEVLASLVLVARGRGHKRSHSTLDGRRRPEALGGHL